MSGPGPGLHRDLLSIQSIHESASSRPFELNLNFSLRQATRLPLSLADYSRSLMSICLRLLSQVAHCSSTSFRPARGSAGGLQVLQAARMHRAHKAASDVRTNQHILCPCRAVGTQYSTLDFKSRAGGCCCGSAAAVRLVCGLVWAAAKRRCHDAAAQRMHSC